MGSSAISSLLKPAENTRLRRIPEVMARNWVALIAFATLLLIFAAVILAPMVAPMDPNEVEPDRRLLPVGSPGYPLGTDLVGRDILSRVIWGGRSSLFAGVVCSVVTMAIGLCLGLFTGFLGGAFDNIVMRLIDILMAFPFLLLAITVVAALGPSMANAMIAVVVATFPRNTRLIRGQVLSLREQSFVEAARAMGYSPLRIMFSEIAPHVMSTVIVVTTLQVTSMISATAALSFLGLGIQPPNADWGKMISDGRQLVLFAPHMVIVPSAVLSVVCVCFSALGDALQVALHPRSREL